MRTIKLALIALLLLASAGASVALLFFRFEILSFLSVIGKTVTTGGFLAIAAVFVAVPTVVLVFSVVKSLKVKGPSAGRGLLFLLCAAIAILQLSAAISMLMTASDTSKTFAAMNDMSNAAINLLEPGHVTVDGTIGATFFADLMLNHSEKEPIKTIEITSPGGLVDQALLLADFVEKQKVTVIVGEECLSACVIVAVASPVLTAHESSLFGFHQTSPVAETTSELFKLGFDSISADSNKFLSEHGVPADIMNQAEKHGPDEMYEIKAAELMKVGVVKKIIPDE